MRKIATTILGLGLLLVPVFVMADQPRHNMHAGHFPQPKSRYQHAPTNRPKIQTHSPMPIQPSVRRPIPYPPMFPPVAYPVPVIRPVFPPVVQPIYPSVIQPEIVVAPQIVYPASNGFSLSIGGRHGGFSIYADL
ncbi:MAG: hypothetical protein LBT05_15615 [Planctomycetaceae bacterium]|jgi:hypothetical protein|nr:hypothetical protein [Planctomycetaceae bacterium]